MNQKSDTDVVSLYSMTILGPGPGDLKVVFARSSLYDDPWVSFSPEKPSDGYLLSYDFSASEMYLQNRDYLTREQREWLINIDINKIAEKFRNLESVITLSLFD